MEEKLILGWYVSKTSVVSTSRKEECGPVNRLLKLSTTPKGNRLISEIQSAQTCKFFKLKPLMILKPSVRKLDLSPTTIPLNPLREAT